MLVAACQIAPRSPQDTTDVEAAVDEAAAAGARLVVLPELAVTGQLVELIDAPGAAAAEQTTLDALCRLTRRHDVVIVCGLPHHDGEVWWNEAVVVERGQVCGRYRKVHLWSQEKHRFSAAGDPPLVLETAVGRLGVMVCYDLEFPEWPRLAAEAGAQILAVPVNWPRNHHPGQFPVEVAKAQAAAAAYGLHVVIADRHASDDREEWEGGSLICGCDGYLLAGPATLPDHRAGRAVLLADLDPAAACDKSRGPDNHVVADRRPDLYHGLRPSRSGSSG